MCIRDRRTAVKRAIRGADGRPMPVAVHMRDLGAHVGVGAVLCGATLSDRLRKGSTAAKHLRAVPGSIEQKAAVIRGKVLVMSCYGAASTP
eukprot:274250-Alexandrium_andersonii.AAC.1